MVKIAAVGLGRFGVYGLTTLAEISLAWIKNLHRKKHCLCAPVVKFEPNPRWRHRAFLNIYSLPSLGTRTSLPAHWKCFAPWLQVEPDNFWATRATNRAAGICWTCSATRRGILASAIRFILCASRPPSAVPNVSLIPKIAPSIIHKSTTSLRAWVMHDPKLDHAFAPCSAMCDASEKHEFKSCQIPPDK